MRIRKCLVDKTLIIESESDEEGEALTYLANKYRIFREDFSCRDKEHHPVAERKDLLFNRLVVSFK